MMAIDHPTFAGHRHLVAAVLQMFNTTRPPMPDPLIIATETGSGDVDIVAGTFRDAARTFRDLPTMVKAIQTAARRRDECHVPVLASVLMINRAGVIVVTAIVDEGGDPPPAAA